MFDFWNLHRKRHSIATSTQTSFYSLCGRHVHACMHRCTINICRNCLYINTYKIIFSLYNSSSFHVFRYLGLTCCFSLHLWGKLLSNISASLYVVLNSSEIKIRDIIENQSGNFYSLICKNSPVPCLYGQMV